MNRLALLYVGLAACGDSLIDIDAAVPPDAGPTELGPVPEGGSFSAAFTMRGCKTLTVVAGVLYCQTTAPAQVQFIPLASGITDYLWTSLGGMPMQSNAVSPTVSYSLPGVFDVMLAAGGPAGTAVADGKVIVDPAAIGGACNDIAQCGGIPFQCVCASGACPGAFGTGFCSHGCGGMTTCGAGVCADLTRGGAGPSLDGGVPPGDGGVSGANEWRNALCLPACVQSTDCRTGFSCRELPVLDPGAAAGGSYSWRKACFSDWPGDVGDSCFASDGTPSGGSCLSGRCDPYGARGLCTADCSTVACPSYASCATLSGSPGAPLCLRRCDAAHPCTDPLLACETPGTPGALGFTVPPGDPPGTTYCAPRHCTMPSDCAPSGQCRAFGAGSFCVKN